MDHRIAIAMPVQDAVCPATAFDLANCVAEHIVRTDDTIISLFAEGTLLASQRHNLVLAARRENASHILFVDADMRFPSDAILRLLEAEVRVVGANCAKRRMPTGPTAANYVKGKRVPVYTTDDTHGLERVDRVGTGFLLIEMSVFSQIPAPWFETPWVEAAEAFMGEDVAFCCKLQQAKIPIFIDHDVSREIGHIGSFEFRHEHVEATREHELSLEPEPLVVLTGSVQ